MRYCTQILRYAGPAAISAGPLRRRPHSRARSSAGEHYVDIVGVTGSIPVAPTIFSVPSQQFDTGDAEALRAGAEFICALLARTQRSPGVLLKLCDHCFGRMSAIGQILRSTRNSIMASGLAQVFNAIIVYPNSSPDALIGSGEILKSRQLRMTRLLIYGRVCAIRVFGPTANLDWAGASCSNTKTQAISRAAPCGPNQLARERVFPRTRGKYHPDPSGSFYPLVAFGSPGTENKPRANLREVWKALSASMSTSAAMTRNDSIAEPDLAGNAGKNTCYRPGEDTSGNSARSFHRRNRRLPTSHPTLENKLVVSVASVKAMTSACATKAFAPLACSIQAQ